MNYFEFYKIPISFKVDEEGIKKQFYRYSKEYHPDFYTLESEEKQAEVLQLSTLNNEAYQTLSNQDRRMKYVLQLKGTLEEEGNNKIPQDFLMEMMEINEALMELEFGFDQVAYDTVLQQLKSLESALYNDIESIIENYDDKKTTESELLAVKDYYLKKRYLLRIHENLNKFASL